MLFTKLSDFVDDDDCEDDDSDISKLSDDSSNQKHQSISAGSGGNSWPHRVIKEHEIPFPHSPKWTLDPQMNDSVMMMIMISIILFVAMILGCTSQDMSITQMAPQCISH
jgi:hypothetical protein